MWDPHFDKKTKKRSWTVSRSWNSSYYSFVLLCTDLPARAKLIEHKVNAALARTPNEISFYHAIFWLSSLIARTEVEPTLWYMHCRQSSLRSGWYFIPSVVHCDVRTSRISRLLKQMLVIIVLIWFAVYWQRESCRMLALYCFYIDYPLLMQVKESTTSSTQHFCSQLVLFFIVYLKKSSQ